MKKKTLHPQSSKIRSRLLDTIVLLLATDVVYLHCGEGWRKRGFFIFFFMYVCAYNAQFCVMICTPLTSLYGIKLWSRNNKVLSQVDIYTLKCNVENLLLTWTVTLQVIHTYIYLFSHHHHHIHTTVVRFQKVCIVLLNKNQMYAQGTNLLGLCMDYKEYDSNDWIILCLLPTHALSYTLIWWYFYMCRKIHSVL